MFWVTSVTCCRGKNLSGWRKESYFSQFHITYFSYFIFLRAFHFHSFSVSSFPDPEVMVNHWKPGLRIRQQLSRIRIKTGSESWFGSDARKTIQSTLVNIERQVRFYMDFDQNAGIRSDPYPEPQSTWKPRPAPTWHGKLFPLSNVVVWSSRRFFLWFSEREFLVFCIRLFSLHLLLKSEDYINFYTIIQICICLHPFYHFCEFNDARDYNSNKKYP